MLVYIRYIKSRSSIVINLGSVFECNILEIVNKYGNYKIGKWKSRGIVCNCFVGY